jgi:glycosyltransferase involved in cell wall biosynthesis
MKLSVVIPVYNEHSTIENIISAVKNANLPKVFNHKEIIIVDDCSKDGTREILRKIQDKDIKVVFHDNNMGKGNALKSGFNNATGEIIIIQDADLEYDPNEYSKLVRPILENKADVVYGSRFVGGESHRILYYWHSLGNKIITTFSNMLSDLNLTDMETCYKVFRKDVISKIKLEEPRFGFEPEFTAKVADLARNEGVRIYEVGISYYGRTYEEGKKIGLKDAIEAFLVIIKHNTTKLACFIRYAFIGIFIALSQFMCITVLVDLIGFDTIMLENISNLISIEVSILIGFILHSRITWQHRFTSIYNAIRGLLYFHGITTVSFAIRAVLFYWLSFMKIDYRLNTTIGIIIAIIINFIGYNKYVFSNKDKYIKKIKQINKY